MNNKCSCCGFFTLPKDPMYFICPVCFWQNDSYQEEYINNNGGPNLVSLCEARENFQKFRASEERFKNLVRPPLTEEVN